MARTRRADLQSAFIGRRLLLVLAALLAASGVTSAEPVSPAPTTEHLEFFETHIRPLFAEHCYSCHSEKAQKLKGGLRLDSAEGIQKGGDSGPAIVPGNADGSLLIKAVRYSDPDLQMPPKNKKLPSEKIADLEMWVKLGAPLPANTTPALSKFAEARKNHWAFQPLSHSGAPAIQRSRWPQTPVDHFVLAELEKQNLNPAPAADRRTLIRRLSYDLLGLPPTFAEVEQFIADSRPDAYARLVERLLASPHYGERWARYWLDIARYADTKGYLAGGEERRYAFSYTYRDYVVRAFNTDKPYDQFLLEQIAADVLLPSGATNIAAEKRSELAALGFLTLGRRFLNNRNDIIDDRIDVVTRGTLGLTVTCARCHDHKFDPISTKDYYAMHGVFASSEEPSELPLLGVEVKPADYEDYLKQKAAIEAEVEAYKDREVNQFKDELRQQVGDYLLAVHESRDIDPARLELFADERKLKLVILKRWIKDLKTRAEKPDPIFSPWFALTRAAGTNMVSAPILLPGEACDGANPLVTKAFQAATNLSLRVAAETYTKLFKDIDSQWKASLDGATKAKSEPPKVFPEPPQEALRQILYADGAAMNLPKSEAEEILAGKIGVGVPPIRNKIDALNWTHPGAPARAMALQEKSKPANSHVLKRGNPSNPGEEVPRRFLEILSREKPQPFTNGSGRLELARAIAAPQNPLTARVFANRVWLHHFGQGLVRNPGDFGVRTERPLHLPLLDYLARSFIESGWSTKSLHRIIVLSATYQQSSEPPQATITADPDNRFFSRMSRRRLDFEALRDTLLAASGKLDLRMGGLPIDIFSEPFSTRRTLYAYIDRQNLPGLFRTFDFANPDTSNQGRFETTVPPQALFLMNSPFVLQQARNLATRSEVRCRTSAEAKVTALYQVVLQRPPSSEEIQLAAKYLMSSAGSGANASSLEKLAQVLLLSNEAVFVD